MKNKTDVFSQEIYILIKDTVIGKQYNTIQQHNFVVGVMAS